MQLCVFWHMHQSRPSLFGRHAHDLNDLLHLIPLERYRLLVVHFGFLAFEDRPQRQELGEDAPNSPEIDCRCVMPAAQEKLGCAVPDGDNNFVSVEQGMQRLLKESSQAKISNTHLTSGSHHDVRRLQVAMQDPVSMQVEQSIQDLKKN